MWLRHSAMASSWWMNDWRLVVPLCLVIGLSFLVNISWRRRIVVILHLSWCEPNLEWCHLKAARASLALVLITLEWRLNFADVIEFQVNVDDRQTQPLILRLISSWIHWKRGLIVLIWIISCACTVVALWRALISQVSCEVSSEIFRFVKFSFKMQDRVIECIVHRLFFTNID